jgi:hypothetical protein
VPNTGPIYWYDRVGNVSTTTGTGTYTLGAAITGYQDWVAVGDQHLAYYVAEDVDSNGVPTGAWEVGLGLYSASGTTLARNVVLSSSNGGSAVNWSAGTRRVWLTSPAAATSIAQRYLDPTTQAFSWGNQGTATVTSTQNTMYMVVPANASGNDNLHLQYMVAPATPYSAVAAFRLDSLLGMNTYGCFGLFFRDSSTGKLVVSRFIMQNSASGLYWEVDHFSDPNTYVATSVTTSNSVYFPPAVVWLKVHDDGTTNFNFSASMNGIAFSTILTESRTAYLTTPDGVGWFCGGQLSGGKTMTLGLFSWQITG